MLLELENCLVPYCIELVYLNVTSQGLVFKVNMEPSLWYHYWNIQDSERVSTEQFSLVHIISSGARGQGSITGNEAASALRVPAIPSWWLHTNTLCLCLDSSFVSV